MQVYTHKTINADFNSINELIDLFIANPCKCLGVISGERMATVEAKRKVKGVNGWVITYGVKGGKALVCESKSTSPTKFTQSVHCNYGYDVIEYNSL